MTIIITTVYKINTQCEKLILLSQEHIPTIILGESATELSSSPY